MRIDVIGVLVDDQDKAVRFYTEKLGFTVRQDVAVGEARWLSVGSSEQPDGPQLLLEPRDNPNATIEGQPAAHRYQQALYEAGIPFTMFTVNNIAAEYRRLTGAGVAFVGNLVEVPGGKTAVFDDTCGNLIAIMEVTE
ncbi:MAG TPA: VOC family protein [Candidatus Stackebrandtia excrementipullorum]|nr:VOC family protein [Candidatus Stackebrandtia excrementipullorum]